MTGESSSQDETSSMVPSASELTLIPRFPSAPLPQRYSVVFVQDSFHESSWYYVRKNFKSRGNGSAQFMFQ